MKNERNQNQEVAEAIAYLNGVYNFRIYSLEFEYPDGKKIVKEYAKQHPEISPLAADASPRVILNCVKGNDLTKVYRYEVEYIGEKDFDALRYMSPDWRARLSLERFPDAEGNPVPSFIEDDAGFKLSAFVAPLGIVEAKPEPEPAEEVDYAKQVFDAGRKAMILKAIEIDGIHIVAEWEGGGSDALDIPVHDKATLLKEYPEVSEADADAYFSGERDGFVIRRWIDDEHDNEQVTDTAYFPIGDMTERDGAQSQEIEYDDMESTVTLRIEAVKDVLERYDKTVERKILKLSERQLELLLNGLSFMLSGTALGDTEAFELMAHIESLAIAEKKRMESRK